MIYNVLHPGAFVGNFGNRVQNAIVLLGHGSPDREGMMEFQDFAKAFQPRGISLLMDTGRMDNTMLLSVELSGLPLLLEHLAGMSVKRVVIVPCFLFFGHHLKHEIPQILNRFRTNFPRLHIACSHSLWPHDYLIRAAKDRIIQTLCSFPKELREDVDVLVVGRGSSHADARLQFTQSIRHLEKEIFCRRFAHCFLALTEPEYASVLPEMIKNGSRRLVVFPFYMFKGILVNKIHNFAREVQSCFDGVTIKCALHLGAHPLMFELICSRILEIFDCTESRSPENDTFSLITTTREDWA